MDLCFSPAAQVELDDAFAYLEGEEPGLGYRFIADVVEALDRIQMYPLAWHPLGRNLRRCHLKHFRYGVIYRIRGD
ncbi:MAG: type II toxin-antitoxin system RelE/ParE family toxin [Sulfuritalea sp.]|nr:type II toxin-antitoxin system RelE/ParE family toxin [Sulfuritalea sp.]